MKTLIVALSVFMAVHVAWSSPNKTPHTFAIASYYGYGHGCAVNGLTVTNRHMVDNRDKNDFSQPHKIRFRYEYLDGTSGSGYSSFISNTADVAIVKLDKESPYGYGVIGDRPKVDDKIYWVEYDFRKQKNVFKPRVRDGKVISVFAGIVLLKEGIVSGASGGCAYNETGQIIGIMAFGVGTEDHKKSAGVVGLWGSWWNDVKKEEK